MRAALLNSTNKVMSSCIAKIDDLPAFVLHNVFPGFMNSGLSSVIAALHELTSLNIWPVSGDDLAATNPIC
ncbi:MAG: hypothetical protein ACJAUG_001269 [Halioglobus sp.]